MKSISRLRFVVIAVVLTMSLLVGPMLWRLHANRQARSLAAATAVTRSSALSNCKIFFCGDLSGQNSELGALVTKQGGQIQSRLGVDTDFVVMASNQPTEDSAQIVQTAKDLHIPIMSPAQLMSFARAQ